MTSITQRSQRENSQLPLFASPEAFPTPIARPWRYSEPAYLAGYGDGYHGVAATKNPYPSTTPGHWDYLTGWRHGRAAYATEALTEGERG
jgi:ribosome modulation factor